MSKKCSRCKEIKHLDEFHNQKASKDGKQGACKICNKKYGSNVTNKKKTGREKVIPNYLLQYEVEAESGVYAIITRDKEEIVYIGKGTSLRERLHDHLGGIKTTSKQFMNNRALNENERKMYWFKILHYSECKIERDLKEKEFQDKYKPIFNHG